MEYCTTLRRPLHSLSQNDGRSLSRPGRGLSADSATCLRVLVWVEPNDYPTPDGEAEWSRLKGRADDIEPRRAS